MSASYGYVIDSGTITYDTSTLLADVQAEYAAALGANINPDASTPQGTLIQGETLSRTKTMKNNCDVANVINPNLSYGVFLDAVCSFLGIDRGSNTPTIVTGVTVVGTPIITTISANSRVSTPAGDVFFVASDTEIPAGGTTTVTIFSQAFGNIPAPVGNLNIIDNIVGWASCTIQSGSSVTPGTTAYSDPQLKIKRKQQLAKQGRGHIGALRGNIVGIAGVIDCNVVENNTGVVQTVNGVTFTKPNAMWFCVAGVTPSNQQAIIDAAYAAHGGGCPWDYGSASGTPIGSAPGIPSTDPTTGMPYYVEGTSAVFHDVYVNITVKQGTNTADVDTAVPNAMVLYASGQEDSEDGLLLGTAVSAFEMSGAVARQLPGIYIKTCQVAVVPAGSAPPAPGAYVYEVILNPWDIATLSASRVNVSLAT